MPQLVLGDSSSADNPAIDVYVTRGNPAVLTDVVALQFRIFDATTPPNFDNPPQVYPTVPGGWKDVDPTKTPAYGGVRLGAGHYFAPWTPPPGAPAGNYRIAWQYRISPSSPWERFSEDFLVAANPGTIPAAGIAGAPGASSGLSLDPGLYCSVESIRAEGFRDSALYPDAWVREKIALWSRFVDKATGRWFYPKEFPLAKLPFRPVESAEVFDLGSSPACATPKPNASEWLRRRERELVRARQRREAALIFDSQFKFEGSLNSGGKQRFFFRSADGQKYVYPTTNLLPGVEYPVPTELNLQQGDRPMMISGQGRRDLISCDLDVPICRIDALGIENQAFLFSQITWIPLSAVRVFNRHLRGMTQPDDRESPRIAFTVAGRIVETIASGLYPAPRIYPHGRMNVFLFGAFGYTDPDPTGAVEEGITPLQIQRATRLLVIRDLLPESKAQAKIAYQNLYRIIQDHEGSTSVGLQQLWLKGGVTGNPEIDTILQAYRRQARIGVS